MLRLITIPISHYCEKARWSLDRAGIEYREERHIQGIHRVVARRVGGGMTVPVLVTEERVIPESEEILEWVDARTPEDERLFPADPTERAEVDALCARFDEELGPKGRRLIYVHMFPQQSLVLRYNGQGVPTWEQHFFRYSRPLAERLIRRVLDIRPGVEVQDEAAVFREFDFVAERLADGRPYLCGEHFGAADLTFAALAASVLMPPQYGVRLPQPDEFVPATADLVNRTRAHPAGRFAMRMFAEHRQRASA